MKEETRLSGNTANLSAEKLLKILEFMARQKEAVRIIDISNALGLNQSTVLRFINSLIQNGYIDRDPETGRYYMTFKICSLAKYQMGKLEDWSKVRPYLEEISNQFGETCCLAVERDRRVIYVEVVESPDSMIRSMQRIGNVAMLHCTGTGKIFLSQYTPEEIDKLIEEVGLTRFTEYTITTREELLEELEKIRREGKAYDNEECEIGARCVAFPVRNAEGRIVAGISVTGPAQRMQDERIDGKLEAMRKIVEKVSANLGYRQD